VFIGSACIVTYKVYSETELHISVERRAYCITVGDSKSCKFWDPPYLWNAWSFAFQSLYTNSLYLVPYSHKKLSINWAWPRSRDPFWKFGWYTYYISGTMTHQNSKNHEWWYYSSNTL